MTNQACGGIRAEKVLTLHYGVVRSLRAIEWCPDDWKRCVPSKAHGAPQTNRRHWSQHEEMDGGASRELCSAEIPLYSIGDSEYERVGGFVTGQICAQKCPFST